MTDVDVAWIATAIRQWEPRIAAGVDADALAGRAHSEWAAVGYRVEPALLPITAVATGVGRQAGADAGRIVAASYIAASALDRAEPVRAGMSERHRRLAHTVQVARVGVDALHTYLAAAGWTPAATWRGSTIYHAPDGDTQALVPRPGVRDHVLRANETVQAVAEFEDRDVAELLAVLAPPPARPPLSHAGLRYLWRVHQAATELTRARVPDADPGPGRGDYDGIGRDKGSLGRMVVAVGVGYRGGWQVGHHEGSRAAVAQILSRMSDPDGPFPPDGTRIDGLAPPDWLRATTADARRAGDLDLERRGPGGPELPPVRPAGRAFPQLRAVPADPAAPSLPPPPPLPPTHRPHR